jgi:hypothetical protein
MGDNKQEEKTITELFIEKTVQNWFSDTDFFQKLEKMIYQRT